MRALHWLVDFLLHRHRPQRHDDAHRPTFTEIRLVSDGTPQGTTLLTDDGRIVDGVESVSWSISVDGMAKAVVVFGWMAADAMARNVSTASA